VPNPNIPIRNFFIAVGGTLYAATRDALLAFPRMAWTEATHSLFPLRFREALRLLLLLAGAASGNCWASVPTHCVLHIARYALCSLSGLSVCVT
jgi:hypothetical protein